MSSSIHEPLPEGAIVGGHDVDGDAIFVGRAWHEGDCLPAKVIPSKESAYVAYGGQEIKKDRYDVLCNGTPIWINVYPSTKAVPPFSVEAGTTSNGEKLYIGKMKFIVYFSHSIDC